MQFTFGWFLNIVVHMNYVIEGTGALVIKAGQEQLLKDLDFVRVGREGLNPCDFPGFDCLIRNYKTMKIMKKLWFIALIMEC